MATRDTETLAQLVSERAGKRGSGLQTFVQLSKRSVDPRGDYRPSPNLLWKIASGQDVKINEQLVRAVAAGLELPLERVQAAAARQYLGWQVSHPAPQGPAEDDEVISVGHRPGLTASDMPRVGDAIEDARDRDTPE
jgi:hypothetical protein